MPKNRCRLVRTSRLALLLSAIAVIFATQAATSFAASHESKSRRAVHAAHRSVARNKAHDAGGLPAQGIFDSCSLSSSLSTCEQDLQQIHQAGMQVAVVGLSGDTLAELSSYASYAQSIGMSIMWEINDPGFWGGAWIGAGAATDWPSFSSACGCTSTTQVLSYMIGFLKALPATYGYYAADDWTLTPSDKGGLRQYVNEIQAVDPSDMVMIGSAQGDGTTYYSTGATIGNEIYPESTQSLMPYDSNLAMWQSLQQSVGQDQRAATDAGSPSAFILQAFTFGDNLSDGEAVGACTASMSQAQCANRLQYPSAGVQLALRNSVLQNAQPKLILWYTYGEASQGNRWADLTGVVNAPYPVSASAARAKNRHRTARHKTARNHRKAAHHRKPARKHGARRRGVGHTHAA